MTVATRSNRGRPRDPVADRAILEAARRVLADKGYTGTSMEAVARTAGVGKDTLYRRWRSKSQLVEHLLTVLAEENVPLPSEEDPSYALFLFLQDIVRFNTQSDFGAIVAGIVGEGVRNPGLSRAFHTFWRNRRNLAADLVREVVDPSMSDSDVQRLVDQVVGPIYYRLLLTGEPLPDEYLWDLVTSLPQTARRGSQDRTHTLPNR